MFTEGEKDDEDFIALDNTQAGIGDTVLINRDRVASPPAQNEVRGKGRATEPGRCSTTRMPASFP